MGHTTGTTTTDPVPFPAGDAEQPFDSVEYAVAQIAAGRAVVVVDDEGRENEGDIVFAAELATTELVAFAMTECRGLLCAPMTGVDLDRLELDQMVRENTEHHRTAFTVSVDAAAGISTGISAADRALTLRLLAEPGTRPAELVRPGHVFPLRAVDGGVPARPGHTEAGVDLCRLAGLRPAAAICEIVMADGAMARVPELRVFARRHGLALITIADLTEYLRSAGTTTGRAGATGTAGAVRTAVAAIAG